MKNIFFVILITACLASCKKEQHTNAALKKYRLSFDVSGFTQTTGPFTNNSRQKTINSTTDTLSGFIDKLIYLVYDSNQRLITTKIQLSGQPNYTVFTDSLPSGTYTAIFIGGKNGLIVPAVNTKDSFNYGSDVPWDDCFYKKISITVTNQVQQTVQLDRITAQLQLKILDQIPANVAKFKLVHQEHPNFNFLTGAFSDILVPVSLITPISAGNIGSTNYTIQTYTLNNGPPFNLSIYAYDSTDKLLIQKTVLNVVCIRNKRTIISGNLFSTNDQFSITTDTAWNAPTQHPF
jgi:hypothetical protein